MNRKHHSSRQYRTDRKGAHCRHFSFLRREFSKAPASPSAGLYSHIEPVHGKGFQCRSAPLSKQDGRSFSSPHMRPQLAVEPTTTTTKQERHKLARHSLAGSIEQASRALTAANIFFPAHRSSVPQPPSAPATLSEGTTHLHQTGRARGSQRTFQMLGEAEVVRLQ